MFEGFKTTKAERDAVEKGWYTLDELCQHDGRNGHYLNAEKRGYGNSRDSVPLIAAKGLCIKWFLQGRAQPDIKLADYYTCRDAAIWFTGNGCRRADDVTEAQLEILKNAVKAFDAAFARMMVKDRFTLEG